MSETKKPSAQVSDTIRAATGRVRPTATTDEERKTMAVSDRIRRAAGVLPPESKENEQ